MNKNASVGIPMKKICGRLTRILCTCAVFVSLTGAAYAQSAPVTLDRKKAPVREILNEIERQTDYLFVYSSEQVDFSVSVTAHDEPVQTVLRRIFEGTPIRFTLEGKRIGVPSKENISCCAGSLKRPRTPPRLRLRNRPSRVR